MMENRKLRRHEAAALLKERYGFGSTLSLGKLACTGGGPPFYKIGPKIVVYDEGELIGWAESKLSARHSSTSDFSRKCKVASA